MAAIVLTVGIGAPAIACSTDDITVSQSTWRADGEYTRVVGEIKNGCSTPIGVQLQSVFKRGGAIVHIVGFWPASTNNIKAGGSFAFGTMDRLNGLPFDQVEVRVISVRSW